MFSFVRMFMGVSTDVWYPILLFAIKNIVAKSIDYQFGVQLESVKKHNAIELEKLKVKLATESDLLTEINKRKMNSYSKLVEILYRIKKLSNSISGRINLEDKEVITEFGLQCKELENVLYMSIIDLENDKIFSEIHDLKNNAINFNIVSNDIIYLLESEEFSNASKLNKNLKAMSDHIGESVQRIIGLFTEKGAGAVEAKND